MGSKFGNYLFRNLKSGSSATAGKPAGEPPSEAAVEDQEIVLRPEDFTGDLVSALNWDYLESKVIHVKLKQTDGLMEGRVSISAKTLRELHPKFVSNHIKDDSSFPISLRTVVLQLQNVIQSAVNGPSSVGAPDFDTPIAQVAREDEGFFKLEEHARQPGSVSGSADRPPGEELGSFLPLIREKTESREDAPVIPPVEIVAPAPKKESVPSRDPTSVLVDPFAGLPKSKSTAEPSSVDPEPASEVRSETWERRLQPDKPTRRRGLERLQEIFLTDDYLDAAQVARSLRAFPKVRSALIMLDDGTILGGGLPEGYQQAAASAAPAMIRAVREFGTALSSAEVTTFTLLADMPISIFLEGRVCIVVAHEGRGLLPGMREQFTNIAKALDALYAPGADDQPLRV